MAALHNSKGKVIIAAVLMALFSILWCPLVNAGEQQAYTVDDLGFGHIRWSTSGSTRTLKVEQGEKFNIGNYMVYDENLSESEHEKEKHLPLSMIDGVVYSSSNPKTVSIDSQGIVQTKKKGKATLKVKLAPAECTYEVKVVVVGKGSLTGEPEAKYMEREVAAFEKTIPKSLTAKNCLKFLYTYMELEEKLTNQLKGIDMYGTAKKKGATETSLAVPEAGSLIYAKGLLRDYRSYLHIFDHRDKEYIRIASMAADSDNDTIILKLRAPMGANQIFSLKYDIWASLERKNMDSRESACNYRFRYISDNTAGEAYMGRAEFALNSDIVEVKLCEYTYEYLDEPVQDIDLIKGHTYRFMGWNGWDRMLRRTEAVAVGGMQHASDMRTEWKKTVKAKAGVTAEDIIPIKGITLGGKKLIKEEGTDNIFFSKKSSGKIKISPHAGYKITKILVCGSDAEGERDIAGNYAPHYYFGGKRQTVKNGGKVKLNTGASGTTSKIELRDDKRPVGEEPDYFPYYLTEEDYSFTMAATRLYVYYKTKGSEKEKSVEITVYTTAIFTKNLTLPPNRAKMPGRLSAALPTLPLL